MVLDSNNPSNVTVQINNKVSEEIKNIDSASKFIGDNSGNTDNIFSIFVDIFKPILQPVKVAYSNELLADQIYGISIALFFLSIIIIVLFIIFCVHAIVLIYREKILNYFTNKYIKAYLNFNNRIIGLEFIFVGLTVLYFLYQLSKGLHFLATIVF